MAAQLTKHALTRYQIWRKRMLNQRKSARKLTRVLLLLLVPLGLGVAASRSEPQLKEAAEQLRHRLRRPAKLLPEPLRPEEKSEQQAERREEAPKEQAAKKKFGSWF